MVDIGPRLRAVTAGNRWFLVPAAIAIASRAFSVAVILVLHVNGRTPARNPFLAWDGQWYREIARHGYHAEYLRTGPTGLPQHDFAFFPAWPMLLRFVRDPGPAIGIAAPVLANLLFIAAAIVVWRVLDHRFGSRSATAGTALLAFSPAAYVFSMGYSESLFLFLAAASFLLATSRWRGLATFAAMLTRISGAAMVASALVAAVTSRGLRRRAAAWGVAGGVLAFAGWWVYVGLLTSDPAGFLRGSPSWLPQPGPGQLLEAILSPTLQSTAWLAFVIIVVGGSLLAVRRDWELGVYAVATCALILLPGAGLFSMPRYVAVAFPAFAALGERLDRRVLLALIVVSAVGQVVFASWTIPGRSVAP